MKLSILDQSPIYRGYSSKEAIEASLKLAQLGDDLGYTRFWLTEHHGFTQFASSAPEVILSYIAMNTNKIKVGTGATLLPHYAPYKVAEVFNTLETIFPNRMNLGVGRAPGGPQEATDALTTNLLKRIWAFPESVDELLRYLLEESSSNDAIVMPKPDNKVEPWLLGTSGKSAKLAAKYGISYNFGLFMSDKEVQPILDSYRNAFQMNKLGWKPEVAVTISAICAETSEEAEHITERVATQNFLREKGSLTSGNVSDHKFSKEDKNIIQSYKGKIIFGDPREVKKQLEEIRRKYNVDEIMINTNIDNEKERLTSYRLIGEIMNNKK